MAEKIDDSSAYYDALDALGCPSQLMGRVTMQMHYAPDGRFVAADKTPAGHEACHVAVRAGGYMMVLDTHGTLVYPETEVESERNRLTCTGPWNWRGSVSASSVWLWWAEAM